MEYRKFDIATDTALLPQLVECYQLVFATPPWNEWKKCVVCDAHWGLDDPQLEEHQFVHCDHPVDDFWGAARVTQDFYSELVYPGISCWIALDEGKIIGFCHGYPASGAKLAHKLEFLGLDIIIDDHFGETPIAYQDEIGVLISYRGRGIGKELFRRRNLEFLEQGLKIGIIRTMSNPPSVTYQWYNRLGYQTIAHYNDLNRRVILAFPLADLPASLSS